MGSTTEWEYIRQNLKKANSDGKPPPLAPLRDLPKPPLPSKPAKSFLYPQFPVGNFNSEIYAEVVDPYTQSPIENRSAGGPQKLKESANSKKEETAALGQGGCSDVYAEVVDKYPQSPFENCSAGAPKPVTQKLEEPIKCKRGEYGGILKPGGSSEVYAEVVDKLVPDESKGVLVSDESQGVLIERRQDVFFNLTPHEECRETLRLPVPEDDLEVDSLYVCVTSGTDLLKAVVENLKNFLQTPEGCGVKNLTMLAENCLVMDYLKSIGRLSAEAHDRALRNLRSGYERQLTFKRSDGSFSPHGERDKHGSTWLTAYVLTVFHQVAQYIDFDRHVRKEAIRFLQSRQEANGSYREDSCLFEMSNINDVGLTAFVVLVMLEADGENVGPQVFKSLNYIRRNRAACESEQSKALAAYVLEMVPAMEKGGLSATISSYVTWQCEPLNGEAAHSLDDLLAFARKVHKWGGGEYDVIVWDADSDKRLGSLNVRHAISQDIGQIELPKRTREIVYEVKGYGRGWFRICYSYRIRPRSNRPCFQLIN